MAIFGNDDFVGVDKRKIRELGSKVRRQVDVNLV